MEITKGMQIKFPAGIATVEDRIITAKVVHGPSRATPGTDKLVLRMGDKTQEVDTIYITTGIDKGQLAVVTV